MTKQEFVCMFMAFSPLEMEVVYSSAVARAELLEKNGMFAAQQQAAPKTYPTSSGANTYTGQAIKDPDAPATVKQMELLFKLLESKDGQDVCKSDPYMLKNGKMTPEFLGEINGDKYTGKYTKAGASKVIEYVREKMDFSRKIGALMKELGKTPAECQAELDRFRSTSKTKDDAMAWENILNEIRAKKSAAAAEPVSIEDDDPF